MKSKVAKIFFGALVLVIIFKSDSAKAFFSGEGQGFNVDPAYDAAGRTTINATLRYVGDKSLIYAEDDWWSSLGNRDDASVLIKSLGQEFDQTIYPRLTQVFGSEWSPGIDNEYRITILISPMKEGTGGYFNSADEFSKTQVSASNEREMIYLNASYLSSSRAKVFLAHEFQHLITFYQKEKLRYLTEDVWLNEARSEYAATLCGYDNLYQGSNLEKRVSEFLRNPSDSLTEWENKSEDYGAVNLFMQYLVGRYSENILTRMVKADAIGIASINQALEEMGSSERFDDIFTNWTVANYVNDCQFGDGQKFCYLNQQLPFSALHLSPAVSNTLAVQEGAAFSFSDNAKDWSAHWYEILSSGSGLNLALSFSGAPSNNWQVPIIVYKADGSKSLRYLALSKATGEDIIVGFGSDVKKIVLIPSSQKELTNYSASEIVYPFSYTAEMTTVGQLASLPAVLSGQTFVPSSVAAPNYPDGSLIRAIGDYRVYVINSKYKRWIRSPAILAAYQHFSGQSIIEVTPSVLNQYQDAWLIRADGDFKVYEINGDLTKHWLNMSVDQFAQSGRSWNMVFVVNKTERDLYKTGSSVLK